jgi:hypothetical protein
MSSGGASGSPSICASLDSRRIRAVSVLAMSLDTFSSFSSASEAKWFKNRVVSMMKELTKTSVFFSGIGGEAA